MLIGKFSLLNRAVLKCKWFFKLLTETRELKSNVAKIDYREKVHKASFWIEYYIIPLNQILDVHQYDSVASKLYEVSEYVNQKRLLYQEEDIRSQFEKLYSQLIQVNDNLLRQSKILSPQFCRTALETLTSILPNCASQLLFRKTLRLPCGISIVQLICFRRRQ